MAWKARVDVRLATQVLLLQIAVVALTLGLAGALLAFLSHQRIAAEVGTRALDIASVVAAAPAVRADVARYDAAPLTPGTALTNELAAGQLQSIASEVQKSTDVLFVVITNDRASGWPIRTRAALGQHVSTDPAEALAGHEVVLRQSGTLGRLGARESTCLRARIPKQCDRRDQRRYIDRPFAATARRCADGGGAGRGGAAWWASSARCCWPGGGAALTLGLQPAELVEMVRGQAAVLHGIGEGVLAADTSWRTTFVNDEACRLLAIGAGTGSAGGGDRA